MKVASIKEIVPEIGSNRQSDRLGQFLNLQDNNVGTHQPGEKTR